MLRSLCEGGVTVPVDPTLGFSALADDKTPISTGINLEVGRPKNLNKSHVPVGTELTVSKQSFRRTYGRMLSVEALEVPATRSRACS